MANFTCPHAFQLKTIKALGCKWLMKAGETYNTHQQEANIMCSCQRYCPTQHKIINSDGALKCYQAHSTTNTDING